MTCPNPFEALQALEFPTFKTWRSRCDWPLYLESDAAYLESTLYLEKKCKAEAANDMMIQCPLLNQYCNSADLIFASPPVLTVCSLHPNMTLNQLEHNRSPRNETLTDSRSDYAKKHAFELSSVVSTGLLGYCATVSGCSPAACSTAGLYDLDGKLSSQGIGRCWIQICNSYVASINPDFGGLGVRLANSKRCVPY